MIRLRAAPSRAASLLVVVLLAACEGSDAPTAPEEPCSGYLPQAASPFVLPYQVGSAYRVIQGNCGSFSHLPDGPWRYAFDFDMPIGTAIVAVRAGTVIEVREQFVDGNRITGQENLIWVRHGDNSIGRYLHLTQNGALVSPGDEVTQGMVIGLSGDTGFSTQPHLHFDVAACGGTTCETMPVVFRNTQPNPQGLVRGISYVAEPY